jgi:hypothetical protein
MARGGTQNRQVLLLALLLAGIGASEEVRKHVANKLQRNVLERPGRAVPQLEHVLVVARLAERRDLTGAEGRVRAVDNVLEVGRRDRRLGHEQAQNTVRQLGEREASPRSLPVGRERGNLGRDVQAAVGGEAGENRLWG